MALGWTQDVLGARAHVSQSQVSRLEMGDFEAISVAEMTAVLDILDVRVALTLESPFIARPGFVRDAAHAHCVAYVAGRLERAGWEVRLEVEVREARSHGWIDVLAHQRAENAVFVGEIKTTLEDLGGAQRQLGWYERAAWSVGRGIGWRIDRVGAAMLLLATDEVERRILDHAALLRHAFPTRGARFGEWLAAPSDDLLGPGLALVDPRSKRRQWLVPTRTEGRRTALPYRDYADFMVQHRTLMAPRSSGAARQGQHGGP